MKWFNPKSAQASRLRQKKHQLLNGFDIPASALPGSLALTHRRCGKPSCHCAKGKGHPMWSLTFMVDGKKHVERIPKEWVDEIQPLVEQGRQLKKMISEILALNAQLLVIFRKNEDKKSKKKRKR